MDGWGHVFPCKHSYFYLVVLNLFTPISFKLQCFIWEKRFDYNAFQGARIRTKQWYTHASAIELLYWMSWSTWSYYRYSCTNRHYRRCDCFINLQFHIWGKVHLYTLFKHGKVLLPSNLNFPKRVFFLESFIISFKIICKLKYTITLA